MPIDHARVKIGSKTGDTIVDVDTVGSKNVLLTGLYDSDGNQLDDFGSKQYKILTSDVSGGTNDGEIEYVGWAEPNSTTSSASWRICKLTYTTAGNPKQIWADGVATFSKIWDSKATYTYTE